MSENLLYHAFASAVEKAIAPLHARLDAIMEAEKSKPVEAPKTQPQTHPNDNIQKIVDAEERDRIEAELKPIWEIVVKTK